MGVRALFLPDAARLTGYPVVLVTGWERAGHGDFRAIETVGCHHTADGPGEYPSLRIVRDGRSDLAGPLANLGLARSGTVYVFAAGVAWHAGASRWAGFTDLNDEAIGIEAESNGLGKDWTAAQLDCYPRLVAACCYYIRRDASRVWAHREAAIPLGRKPDPTGIDMVKFRGSVAHLLGDPLARIPRTGGAAPSVPDPVKPIRKDDDMIVPASLRRRPDGSFYGGCKIETGGNPASRVCGEAYASIAATYGGLQYAISALNGRGDVIGRWPREGMATLGNNREQVVPLPDGTRLVTFDGLAQPGAEPIAAGMARPAA